MRRILRWSKQKVNREINLFKRSRSIEIEQLQERFGGQSSKLTMCNVHNLLTVNRLNSIQKKFEKLQKQHLIKEQTKKHFQLGASMGAFSRKNTSAMGVLGIFKKLG